MIVLPPETRDEAEVHVFFEGMRAGMRMLAEMSGKRRPAGKEGFVTPQDLMHDLEIFEKNAKELLTMPPPSERAQEIMARLRGTRKDVPGSSE